MEIPLMQPEPQPFEYTIDLPPELSRAYVDLQPEHTVSYGQSAST